MSSLITVMTSHTPPKPKRDAEKLKVKQSKNHYEGDGQNEKKKEKGEDDIGDGGVGTGPMNDRSEDLRRNGGGRLENGDIKGGTEGNSSIRGSEIGSVCCTDGRVWIFLVLGVLTIVFSAVLVGVYMNVKSLTSSLESLEVLPSFVPAIVGGVTGLAVLLLFWKRTKPLVYPVLLLCFSAAVLCVIVAVLTGTRVLQPILNASNCVYTRRARSCRCVVDGDSKTPNSRTKTKDSSLLTIEDVAGCSVVKDILPNMLFTMVGLYAVITLICCVIGVIAILVCRIEYNRKKMQKLEYTNGYSNTPSSSNSESLLEQQTMLPPCSSLSSSCNPPQQQQQQHLQLLSSSPSLHLTTSPAPSPSLSSPAIASMTIVKQMTSPNPVLADIYTNANAIEGSGNCNDEENDEEGETTSSDAVYSPSDVPVGYNEACRMRRSKSFSLPVHRARSRERSPNSTASTSTPPPFSPNIVTANSIANFLASATLDNDGNGNGGSKLAPHRRRNRRAVTLHGLDRDQLMLILNLQMRYLQESDHDSKKPENFALNLTNNSTTDILMKTEEKAENEAKMKALVHEKPGVQSTAIAKSYHDVYHLRDESNDNALNGVMSQVISGNLSGIRGKSRSMKCVGSLGSDPQYRHQGDGSNALPMANAQINGSVNIEQSGQLPGNTYNPVPFSQLQKRSMTPTPRQERLSSTRTSDDEWDFKAARTVRSHTPQPHHFKNNYGHSNAYNNPNFQQYFYGEQQQQQLQQYIYQNQPRPQQLYDFQQQQQQQQQYDHQQIQQQIHQQPQLKQQDQYRSIHQLQQRQIQEMQLHNMQEKLVLEQQAAMIAQQQNMIQQQQRHEQLQRQHQHQQSVNERYQQIVQEQLMKEPNAYMNPQTPTSFPSGVQGMNNSCNDDNEDDDEDDEEPTLITIDLRDVTKTGPVIYENAPPPRKLSHQSGMTNSTSSLASSGYYGISASPQPKSILQNRIVPTQQMSTNPCQISSNPHGQMSRQLSQSSNLSSCSGSIAMEIQKALEASSGNNFNPNVTPHATCNTDHNSEKMEANALKDPEITPGKIIKPKKKLSKKEKKELKEKEKEIKELEKEKQKEKTQIETSSGDPGKSAGLARSDSDVRKSGGIPDRWQTIMSDDGTESAPQTLWENIQKKVSSETVPNENCQQSLPYSRQQSHDSAVSHKNSHNSQPASHAGKSASLASHDAVFNSKTNDKRSALKPGCLKNSNNSTPNIIFPLTYDTTRTPQPYNQNPNYNNPNKGTLDKERQPPVGVASPPPVFPSSTADVSPASLSRSNPLPNHLNTNKKAFIPITPNSSRQQTVKNSSDYKLDNSPMYSSSNNYNVNLKADPSAPPKPPRLHDRKQQEISDKHPGSHQVSRPKSFVNAVGGGGDGNSTGNKTNDSAQIYENNAMNLTRANQNLPNNPHRPDTVISRNVPDHGKMHGHPSGPSGGDSYSMPIAIPKTNQIPLPGNANSNNSYGGAFSTSPAASRMHASQSQPSTMGPNHLTLAANNSLVSQGHQGHPRRQIVPTNQIPSLAVCDTDLDDLPSPQHASPLRCQSLSPPPYAPPPLYKSMECLTPRERSTSSSSSEPHNTSCTLSEPHNASFASSERSYTPPIQREVQLKRRGRGQHSLKLPNDIDHPSFRWRQVQGQAQYPVQGRHTVGRQLSLGDDPASRGSYLPASSRQLSPSLYNNRSPLAIHQRNNNKDNVYDSNINHHQSNLLNKSSSSSSSSSTSPSSMRVYPHHRQQQMQQQLQLNQQQQQQQQPYMLMRRCQSMEDGGGQTGLHRNGWANGSGLSTDANLDSGTTSGKWFNTVNPNTLAATHSNSNSTTNHPKTLSTANRFTNDNSNYVVYGDNETKYKHDTSVPNPKIGAGINPLANRPNTVHPHHKSPRITAPILKSAPTSNTNNSVHPTYSKTETPQQFQQRNPHLQTPTVSSNNFRAQQNVPFIEAGQFEFSSVIYNEYENNHNDPSFQSLAVHEGENPGYAETTI